MTTETTTEATDEAYPWDRPEPFIPPATVSLILVNDTPIASFDEQPEGMTSRVVGLRLGDVTIHTGLSGGDQETLDIIDRLTATLMELRVAAWARLDAERAAE